MNIDWHNWLQHPAGNYLLTWEQIQFDSLVTDLFGYHALQLGLPQLSGLRENRIAKHALIVEKTNELPSAQDITHFAHFEELPFAPESVDLVLLPHTLETTSAPYKVLSEIKRILRPEGHILLSGFNPASLWGLKHSLASSIGHPWLPQETTLLSYSQIKEWLKDLGFEIDGGRFGCYRLPSHHEKWLHYSSFMEKAGDRWWPIFGACYLLSAVKRVSGMHLVGPAWRASDKQKRNLAPATNSSANLSKKNAHKPKG